MGQATVGQRKGFIFDFVYLLFVYIIAYARSLVSFCCLFGFFTYY